MIRILPLGEASFVHSTLRKAFETLDEYNLNVLREALLTPGRISEMSRDSAAFVRKHHDYMKVSRQYIEMYDGLLS